MHLDLEAHTAHANRLADAILAIDHELLRQDMQNFLLGGDRHGARCFDHAIDIARADFLVLDGHHPVGVEAADMATGNTGVHILHLAIGHQLDFLDDFGNRLHRVFDIDNDAARQTTRLLRPDAQHIEPPVRCHLGNNCDDLGGADVEADNQFFALSAHDLPLRSEGMEVAADAAG